MARRIRARRQTISTRKLEPRRGRTLSLVCVALWAVLIAALSLLPHPPGAAAAALIPHAAFVGHAAVYAILSLLIIWAMAGASWRARLIGAVVGAVLFGIVMELLQPLTGRYLDIVDVVANGAGIAAAVLVAAAVAGLRRKSDASKE